MASFTGSGDDKSVDTACLIAAGKMPGSLVRRVSPGLSGRSGPHVLSPARTINAAPDASSLDSSQAVPGQQSEVTAGHQPPAPGNGWRR